MSRVTCQVNQYLVEHVLEVTAPLSVRVTPEVQVTDSGRTAVFNCSVSGYPVTQASAACRVPRASVTGWCAGVLAA